MTYISKCILMCLLSFSAVIFRCEASLLVGLSVHVCLYVVTVVNLNFLIFLNYRVR